MIILYCLIFILLVLFSAFFSSAETSLLAINQKKLNLKAKKKNKKALLLTALLKKPEEFFSTILIGNNFVNIAAASISTVLFTRVFAGNEQVVLLVSTLVTTIILLFFGEMIPKSYAFRATEKLAYRYAYPITFFSYFFYPLVKITSFVSRIIFKMKKTEMDEKSLTLEEIKHFLHSQIKSFRFHSESLFMMNQIMGIAEKDIKSIMTPRLNVVALEENAGVDELKKIILEKRISKIPIYRDNLDNIVGIIHTRDLLSVLLVKEFNRVDLKKIARPPVFISEYSSLNFALKQFKKNRLNMVILIDEYASTIGILTINDIFRDIMGEIKLNRNPISKIGKNAFLLKGIIPVEDVNEQLHLDLPIKPDYTTISGLFVYYFGKLPHENQSIKVKNVRMSVKHMGKRKIDEIRLLVEER